MPRSKADWQNTVDNVMVRLRRNFNAVQAGVPCDAQLTVSSLYTVRRVEIGDLGDSGFLFDRQNGVLELGLSGLNLIYEEGKRRGFGGLAQDDFCEIATALYLFHEWHHVGQGLAEFEDVQVLKRTAGSDKLGELDLMADAVAAQIFAAMITADQDGDRRYYAAAFLGAVKYMIQFCFPAFKFPRVKRHKAQRALGIVLMAIFAERAVREGKIETAFDSPLYPTFSPDYKEMALLSYGGAPSQAVINISTKLRPDSVKELLDLIDSGNVEAILDHARVFA